MPKLSIIVPVYKVEQYIHKCVDSILAQTFMDFELILVDDGSPDRCGIICDEYAEKDVRVKVIHKENGGVSSARNAGLDIAVGAYITFVDSDDYIALDMYEKMIGVIQETGADMVKCGFSEFVDEKITKRITFEDKLKVVINNNHKNKLMNFYFDGVLHTVCWNALYAKELAKKVQFPEKFIAEDNYTSGMYLYYAKKIVFINDVLYFYRQTGNGVNFTAHNKRKIDFVLSTSKLHEDLRELGLQDEIFFLELRKKIARNIFHCARQKKYLTMDTLLYQFVINHLDLGRSLLFKWYKFKNHFIVK